MSNGKKRWVKSGVKCPLCDEETEMLVDDVYAYKERCKKCGWENKFNTMEE